MDSNLLSEILDPMGVGSIKSDEAERKWLDKVGKRLKRMEQDLECKGYVEISGLLKNVVWWIDRVARKD